MTYEEVLKMQPPKWLIEDVLPAGVLSTMYGKEKTGKSLMALDMALCIATGRTRWASHKVHAGPVVYVAAEGQRSYPERLPAWAKKHGVDGAGMAAFRLWPWPVKLRDEASRSQFLQAARPVAPVLIVFDTLAACLGGGEGVENDAGAMQALAENANVFCRDLDAAVLFVHHNAKQGQGMRGSSALPAAMSMTGEVTRTPGGANLTIRTQRDAERPKDPIARKLYTVGKSVCFDEGHYRTGPRTAKVRVTRAQLLDYAAEVGAVSPAMVAARFPGYDVDAAQHALKRAQRDGEMASDNEGMYWVVGAKLAAVA
jgi:RecA-family ATPase